MRVESGVTAFSNMLNIDKPPYWKLASEINDVQCRFGMQSMHECYRSCVEWQQLLYFREVAQQQHFTAAANRLTLSQPALSRSIARLEHELGVPLFDREGRSVRLNRYGKAFLAHVERA